MGVASPLLLTCRLCFSIRVSAVWSRDLLNNLSIFSFLLWVTFELVKNYDHVGIILRISRKSSKMYLYNCHFQTAVGKHPSISLRILQHYVKFQCRPSWSNPSWVKICLLKITKWHLGEKQSFPYCNCIFFLFCYADMIWNTP